MPNTEARTAYSEAMNLMRSMRDLHEREAALLLATEEELDPQSHALNKQIGELRSEWTDLFHQYSDAMARYTVALEQSRAPREEL
jgi:uncharacterized coiled-coil DUF342 family protein